MKTRYAAVTALLGILMLSGCTYIKTNKETSDNMETLNLTQEWDKTFPESDEVNHRKVTFKNRFGITLAADLYEPKNAEGKLAADRSERSLRSCQGTGIGALCADDGRARIHNPCVRSVIYRRGAAASRAT